MPRLLYLLQALPIKIPQVFLDDPIGLREICLAREVISFTKDPSTETKDNRRVGLPDPALYCTAVHTTYEWLTGVGTPPINFGSS